jgi:hypothetical protein
MGLRRYQREAVEAVYRHLRERDDNPCVVIPTAGGKTPCLATICRDAVQRWGGRVLILAHVKELLEQAAEKIRAVAPDLPFGIYSAGLNRRDLGYAVTIAGMDASSIGWSSPTYRTAFSIAASSGSLNSMPVMSCCRTGVISKSTPTKITVRPAWARTSRIARGTGARRTGRGCFGTELVLSVLAGHICPVLVRAMMRERWCVEPSVAATAG